MSSAMKRLAALCLCFCLCFSAFGVTAHADVQIDKALATTSSTPVAMTESGAITANTSTQGCYVAAYGWYKLDGSAVTGKFGTESVRVEIRLDTFDGFFFSESALAYLNNESASVRVDNGGRSLYLSREYAPAVWQPTVIKNPGSETVEVGEWASFVATANYVSDYEWKFMSPEGKRFSVAEALANFPGVTTSENGSEKFNVYGITAEMNGWKVFCVFSGPGGSVDSGTATITVKAAPTPTPEPTPEPTAEPEEEKAEEEEKKNEEGNHEHSFTGDWYSDAEGHWQQCECGEEGEKSRHEMIWFTAREATRKEKGLEEGRCGVCGYTQQREVEYKKGNSSPGAGMVKMIVIGFCLFIILITLIVILASIRNSRRRRRRRRRR